MEIERCSWAGNDPLYVAYHDLEWGVPVHDDRLHFELLTLEGAQAGLSWITILRKRQAYREAFQQFDPQAVARFDEDEIVGLLANPGIVRNELKIRSAVKNARAFMNIQREFGHFDTYIWAFTDGRTVQNSFPNMAAVPASTPLSKQISQDLKRRGFNFVGPTIVYAYMQSAGLVNDHIRTCFRHAEVSQLK